MRDLLLWSLLAIMLAFGFYMQPWEMISCLAMFGVVYAVLAAIRPRTKADKP